MRTCMQHKVDSKGCAQSMIQGGCTKYDPRGVHKVDAESKECAQSRIQGVCTE